MANSKLAALFAVPTLFIFASAYAEEVPVTPPTDLPPGVRDIAINPPPGAVVKSQGRFYIWGDAPYLKQPATPPSANDTPMPAPGSDANNLNPSTAPATEVVRGAVGYVFPDGSYSKDRWGENARVEFGGASAKASTSLTPGPNLSNPQLLSGWTLGGCSNCNLSGIDYEGRELSVKAASDFKEKQLTLTPSISVFSSRNHQDFVQTNPGTATLDWKSTGAKVGLDSKYELNKEIAFGLGGSYGAAKRDTTLTGTDGVAAGSGAMPRVGNAEAKLTYKPKPEDPLNDFSLNTYAGVNNYDTRAPGIATAPGSMPTVKFNPSSDFYAGAGATYKFGTQ